MSQADQEKWDARYAGQDETAAGSPSGLLTVALEKMSAKPYATGASRALDLACGGGRNSLWLAGQGFQVDAVDVSAEGLALAERRWLAARTPAGSDAQADDGPQPGGIRWIQADLDDGLPVSGSYDLVLMIRYLDLNLLEQAIGLLRPGGVLVVELHMVASGESVSGPRNPDFLVQPGALARATRTLEPWLAEEGIVPAGEDRRESLARFIGCRA